jgi:hypothetical protein
VNVASEKPGPLPAEIVEYAGLILPKGCPACGTPIEREMRFYAVGNHAPQFTAMYPCGTTITCLQTMVEERIGQQSNVSSGCRVATLQFLKEIVGGPGTF